MHQPNLFLGRSSDPVDDALRAESVAAAELATQFRLRYIQTFNWGTFPGVAEFPIPASGYLFVGPSGSGKSTVLDAHAALMTPPRWLNFNVAAAEADRHGKDRNLATYVRGAWGQQTGEDREYVSQFLRGGKTTWSAIAETYESSDEKVVSLAQVLWIRGAGTAHADVQHRYVVAERPFDVREFQAFAEADFDPRKLRATIQNAFLPSDFPAYQERFRNLLGIDTDRALRLLHKTQSAKNLGDLNTFLRDFMLDPPETFATADRLVTDFKDLQAAHAAVVSASQQIETLTPARDNYEKREGIKLDQNKFTEIQLGIPLFREQRRAELLNAEMTRLSLAIEAALVKTDLLEKAEAREEGSLRQMEQQHSGQGGNVLADLNAQLLAAQNKQPDRVRRLQQVKEACVVLKWAAPDSPDTLVAISAQAREYLDGASAEGKRLDLRRDTLRDASGVVNKRLQELTREVAAMERQPSNIPSRLLDARRDMAKALKVPENKLPFAGELLQVKEIEKPWTGAIERVLRGLATSLLVSEALYEDVSEYLEHHHTGQRIVYLRTVPHHVTAPRTTTLTSLVRKLDIAQHQHQEWLRDELKGRYDYECVDTSKAFRDAPRAVTLAGQVKRSTTQHEKDDRFDVKDAQNWVLGFDNAAKKKLYMEEAKACLGKLTQAQLDISAVESDRSAHSGNQLQCQTLANVTWQDIDIESVLLEIQSLTERVQRETQARPDLARLALAIKEQKDVYNEAVKARQASQAFEKECLDAHEKSEDKLGDIPTEQLSVALTLTQFEGLQTIYSGFDVVMTLDNLDKQTTQVVQVLADIQKKLSAEEATLKASIEKSFGDFVRGWPVEAAGLDPVLDSAPDFLAKLAHLESDGLPKFQEKFMKLLHQQSDQNLTELMAKLNQEGKAIQERLEQVNEGLRTAPYNPGTYLVIKSHDRAFEQVREFKQMLKTALSQSFKDDPSVAKERFAVLSQLVQRLASQTPEDLKWKALCLDVRSHLEFAAHELDEDEREVEVYLSGAGKSGGQRQKLAATCLAAALRYQLGGSERLYPTFSTIVLDEAFDKADSEFTGMAMNIFRNFGFQMVVATPLKNVMALEPFIGGASFVHFLKESKHSVTLKIEYDVENGRLLLSDMDKAAVAKARAEEEANNDQQEASVS
ncbi:MAG: ATP-binding protein [Polaromonas sp.]